MSHLSISEFEILSDVISPQQATLAPEVARTFLQWKFSARQISRMNALAVRNSSGKITFDEKEELERFVRVGSLINLMQAKALVSIRDLKAD